MWQALRQAIFLPGSDPSWAWRRRMAFAGCAVFLSGILKVVWWPSGDLPHDTMVMANCATGFGATLALYAGLAVADDKFKRDSEAKT